MQQAESPEWMPAISMCSKIAAHEHVLAVAERVDVDFNGSFEESIEMDWVVRRDLWRLQPCSLSSWSSS